MCTFSHFEGIIFISFVIILNHTQQLYKLKEFAIISPVLCLTITGVIYTATSFFSQGKELMQLIIVYIVVVKNKILE